MSTNYYLELPIRLEPGQRLHTETIVEVTADNIIQVRESFHLGKRSAGWRFGFRAHPGRFSTFHELAGLLETTPGARIVDEYGRQHEIVEWCRMARTWGDGSPNGAHTCGDCWCGYGPDGPHGLGADPKYRRGYYTDEDGCEWTEREFS